MESIFPEDGNFANIYNATNLYIEGDEIYIGVFARSQVLVFNMKDSITATYGNGPGDGPGEGRSLFDFFLTRDSLYTLDSFLFRINVYDRKSAAYVRSFPVRKNTTRFAGDGQRFFNMVMAQDSLFEVVNLHGEPLNHFDYLNLPQPEYSLSTEGNMVVLPENRLIYIPGIDSRIFEYFYTTDSQISALSIHNTPDTTRFMPSRSIDQNGRPVVRVPASAIQRPMAQYNTAEELLYVLRRFNDGKEFLGYIDIYNASLKYLYSLDISEYKFTMAIASSKYICGHSSGARFSNATPMCYTYEIVD